MDHKEMCMAYVECRKLEHGNGLWSICEPHTGVAIEGPYTEEKVDEILWDRALEEAHEDYLP